MRRRKLPCTNRPMMTDFFAESLILAQSERWRRGLGMQVERSHTQQRSLNSFGGVIGWCSNNHVCLKRLFGLLGVG